MPERDNITPEIRQAALQAYRGVCTGYQEHSVTGGKIGTVQGTGRRTGPLATDKEVLNNVQLGRPYGLDSAPPAGTELTYLETQGGLIIACERYRRPSITQGQVVLFDGNGAEIKLTYGTGSSRRVEIGKGGTVKDAARKADAVAKNATMQTWMGQVETICNGVVPGGVTPLSATFTDVATISGGSATVGIED